MSKSININALFIAGNLTADPSLKTVGNDQVANFTVATHQTYNTKDGRKNTTTFIPCECWGRRGIQLAKNLRKGDVIFIEGRLEIDQVKDSVKGMRSFPKAVVKQWITGGFVNPTSALFKSENHTP